ncbi:hypothetical protein QFC22_002868 [Naganishia vaughanmartiniae]|uniref:Uncharacterized protein n=1 Tax=Naganishia vaughanmartiniae TaxID=1424756 RepID=A0ACC2XDW7_9TREE|nr:hypothetical protein QFC22_002868 [Naganishia vaughanmartiniae]
MLHPTISSITPPTNPNMYLARAPPPQKQPSGWLSYVFGTVPGLSTSHPNAESGTDDDNEKPPTAAGDGEKQHRASIATTGGESGLVPGSFPFSASAGGGHTNTEKGTIRTDATVREPERRRPKDIEKSRREEEPGGATELVRGGGRLGTATAEPSSAITTKSGTAIPAIVRPSTLVLPSTYIKSSAPALPATTTTTKPTTGGPSKAYLNTSTNKPAFTFQFQQPHPQPTTFASTLASPPVITGTPAYGLSSARGKDGLTDAERVRKEWLDAQKEARKARRREEKRAIRLAVGEVGDEAPAAGLVEERNTTTTTTAGGGGGGETVSRNYGNISAASGLPRNEASAPAPGIEERPRRKKKIRNRDDGRGLVQQVDDGEAIEEAETGIKRVSYSLTSHFSARAPFPCKKEGCFS